MRGNWPSTIAVFRRWKLALVDEVTAASARPDRAFAWIQAVDKAKFDELAKSYYPFEQTEAFGTLDAKLAAALTNILQGEFEKNIQRRKMEALAAGARLTGRQILWLISEHFRLTRADGDVFGLEALFNCSLHNNNLERFMEEWEHWLSCTCQRPEEGVLEVLLIQQLKKCSQLQDELRDFDRLPVGDPRRNYEGLLAITRRNLERVRIQKHRDAMASAIAGGTALASVGQHKNKKADKGRS